MRRSKNFKSQAKCVRVSEMSASLLPRAGNDRAIREATERIRAAEVQPRRHAQVAHHQAASGCRADSAKPAAMPSAEARSTAAEINNETLSEQELHLQQRIAAIENQLEDEQAVFDREETAMQEADKRVKREAEAVKAERGEARRGDVERLRGRTRGGARGESAHCATAKGHRAHTGARRPLVRRNDMVTTLRRPTAHASFTSYRRRAR